MKVTGDLDLDKKSLGGIRRLEVRFKRQTRTMRQGGRNSMYRQFFL